MALKHEWRKEDKTLYLPKTQPELITIPAQKFFSYPVAETQTIIRHLLKT